MGNRAHPNRLNVASNNTWPTIETGPPLGIVPVIPVLLYWPQLDLPGWAFMGFNTSPDGNGDWFHKTTVLTETITVYAIWRPGVAFHSGNAPSEAILPENMYRHVEERGQPLGDAMPPNPIWPGHTFQGWNTRRDGTGTTYTGDVPINLGRTLFAVWNATVTFDANGGEMTGSLTTEVVTGRPIGQAFPAQPVREGFTFAGWNTMPNGSGTTYTATEPDVLSSMTLYAQWAQLPGTYLFSIENFAAYGLPVPQGQSPVGSFGAVSGGQIGLFSGVAPGFSFLGWAMGPIAPGTPVNEIALFSTSASYTYIMGAQNTVIIAVWEPAETYGPLLEVRVYYTIDGGTPVPYDIMAPVSAGARVNISMGTRDGFSLANWGITGNASDILYTVTGTRTAANYSAAFTISNNIMVTANYVSVQISAEDINLGTANAGYNAADFAREVLIYNISAGSAVVAPLTLVYEAGAFVIPAETGYIQNEQYFGVSIVPVSGLEAGSYVRMVNIFSGSVPVGAFEVRFQVNSAVEGPTVVPPQPPPPAGPPVHSPPGGPSWSRPRTSLQPATRNPAPAACDIPCPTVQVLQGGHGANISIYRNTSPATTSRLRRAILHRLNSIDGFYITDEQLNNHLIDGFCSFRMRVGGTEDNAYGLPIRITYHLRCADLNNINTDYLTIVYFVGGRVRYLGGELNPATNTFTTDALFLGDGYFAVIYAPDLIRLDLSIGAYEYYVNRNLRVSDVAPFITGQRTMVPIRFVAEGLNSYVDWCPDTRTVSIALQDVSGDININFAIEQLLPGMDVPAQIVADRTVVPLRFVAESLHSNVIWDANTSSVRIFR